MEINVHDDQKVVDVWLTSAENNDPMAKKQLKEIYAKYAEQQYTVAVFVSGHNSLYESTRDLLLHNRNSYSKQKATTKKDTAKLVRNR